MRDTYTASMLEPQMMSARPTDAPKGMRHSIRPRKSVMERAVDVAPTPAQPKAAPVQTRDVPKVNATTAEVTPAPVPVYKADVNLPRWQDLPMIEAGSRRTSRTAMPVVDAARDSASVRAFDLLRTRLRQTTQENGWTNIGIVSPTSGCGNTFTAVNLALSLSRISASRTILMDMNLRSPSVAKAFDITPRGAMQDFLSGDAPIGDHIVRVSETLALGLNNTVDANSADTLQAQETARALERMRAALMPELVIYDLPAMLAHDDLSAFLPQLDGVLLVSDGTQTMGRDLLECERMLQGQAPLLGVVLNRAREDSIPRYN